MATGAATEFGRVAASLTGRPPETEFERGTRRFGFLILQVVIFLVLFAFQLSKAGYVVAGREVSIVISALIGSILLKEGALGQRLFGAAVVLAGTLAGVLAGVLAVFFVAFLAVAIALLPGVDRLIRR